MKFYKLIKESTKFLRCKQLRSLLLKLDIAKAFGTIAWQFLMEVLVQKALAGNKWREWIPGPSIPYLGFKGRRHPLSHAFYLFW